VVGKFEDVGRWTSGMSARLESRVGWRLLVSPGGRMIELAVLPEAASLSM
jgi:hypothetical protein